MSVSVCGNTNFFYPDGINACEVWLGYILPVTNVQTMNLINYS